VEGMEDGVAAMSTEGGVGSIAAASTEGGVGGVAAASMEGRVGSVAAVSTESSEGDNNRSGDKHSNQQGGHTNASAHVQCQHFVQDLHAGRCLLRTEGPERSGWRPITHTHYMNHYSFAYTLEPYYRACCRCDSYALTLMGRYHMYINPVASSLILRHSALHPIIPASLPAYPCSTL
jgi:hypothetical protein